MLVQNMQCINEVLESRHIGPSNWFKFLNDSEWRHKFDHTLEELTRDQKFAQSLLTSIDLPQSDIEFLVSQGLIETKTERELLDEFGTTPEKIEELYREYDGLGKTKRRLENTASRLKRRTSRWSRFWRSESTISQREQELNEAEKELSNLPSFDDSFERCARLTRFVRTTNGIYIAPKEEANHILYTLYTLYNVLKVGELNDTDFRVFCSNSQNLGYDGGMKVLGWLDAAKTIGKPLDYTIGLFDELVARLKERFEGDFHWTNGELKQGFLMGDIPSDTFVIQSSILLANRMKELFGGFDVEPRCNKPRMALLDKPNLFVSFDIESLINEGREANELVCTIYDLKDSSDSDKLGLKFHYWRDPECTIYGVNPPSYHWDSVRESSLVAIFKPHLFLGLQERVAKYLSQLQGGDLQEDYVTLEPISVGNRRYSPTIKVTSHRRINPTLNVDYHQEETEVDDQGGVAVTGYTPVQYDKEFQGIEFCFCLKFERLERSA